MRLKAAGDAVTPEGKPLEDMLTLDVKLLVPVTATVTVWLCPLLRDRLTGETETEKSPDGCVGDVDPPPPPPHPAMKRKRRPSVAEITLER
jgi:hypothetical protein